MKLPVDIFHLILQKLTITEINSGIVLVNREWHVVSRQAIENRLKRLCSAPWLNFQFDYKECRKTYIKLAKQSYDSDRKAFICSLCTISPPNCDTPPLRPVFQLNKGYISNFDMEMVISFTNSCVEPFYIDWATVLYSQLVRSKAEYFDMLVEFVTEQDIDMAGMKLYRWRDKGTIFDTFQGPPPDGRFFLVTEVAIQAMQVAYLLEEILQVDIEETCTFSTLEAHME